MTEREALKLALEALERCGSESYTLEQEAITAIKEALAQPPLTENGIYQLGYHNGYGFGEAYGKANPPQRTWVGLTHSDIDQGLLRSDYAFKTAEAWRAGVVFAMTKLKEKNT